MTISIFKEMSLSTDIVAQLTGDFCRSRSQELIGKLFDLLCRQGRIIDTNVVD